MHCCNLLLFSLWSYDVFCISISPSVIYQLWSLNYVQITTLISVFMVELRSSTATWARSMVRSDRPTLCERYWSSVLSQKVWQYRRLNVMQTIPTAKTETIQKLFCGTPQKYLAEFDSWKQEYYLKGSLKSLFIIFWLILYIIFSQILFQCFINRKDCKYK